MASLFHRLRERRMVQWALAYLAGAFVVVQLLDALDEPLGLSAGIQLAVVIILGFGFFIALVLGWYHGEQGRQQVSGTELVALAALSVTTGITLWLAVPNREPSDTAGVTVLDQPDPRPRVAVLPCTNESPDPGDSFRATGLHDEILLKLQKISSITSLGSASVFRFADASSATREIAASLGVAYVGTCAVLRDGSRLRVIFRLHDAEGVQLWAQDYDRRLALGDILDIQIDIAARVATEIGAALTAREVERIEARPTDNLLAYELYQRARARWIGRTVPGMREAIDYYEAAIAEDSLFALAYAGLGETLTVLPLYDESLPTISREHADRARWAAERALALDPDLSNAHAVLGYVAYLFDWDWEAAEQRLRLATTLDPGNSQARAWLAEVLITLRQTEEAISEASYAARSDPLSLNENYALATSLWNAGRLEDAEQQFRYSMTLEGGAWGVGAALELVLEQQGRYEEAHEVDLRHAALGFSAEFLDSVKVVVEAERDSSLLQRGVAILRWMEAQIPAYRDSPPVVWYAEIGAMDEAMAAARRTIEARGWVTMWNWPSFALLHSDQRFLAMLDEVGLPRP